MGGVVTGPVLVRYLVYRTRTRIFTTIMSSLEKAFDQRQQPHDHNRQQELNDFFGVITEITQRHAMTLGRSVDSLNEADQQKLIAALNPYLRFEMSQRQELVGTPIQANGDGMLYVSDLDGNILGAETLSDNDLVSGYVYDICALPTPTASCLALAGDGEIPTHNQVLSPVLLLDRAVFKSDQITKEEYRTEVDLEGYQVGLPLAHYLRITTTPSPTQTTTQHQQ